MLQTAVESPLDKYLAHKAKFERLRRKAHLDFDASTGCFASDLKSGLAVTGSPGQPGR